MRLLIVILLINLNSFSCYSQVGLPVDAQATKETVQLYKNLHRLLSKGIMFGHQDDLAYGVNWKYQPNASDIKEVTNDYPAVFGWELGHLELDSSKNLDDVPFEKMKQFIQQAYSKNCIITISWHLRNPLTGKSAWDPELGTVASVLPGGIKHDLYKSWLDKLAVFFNDLKTKNGTFIPVIFRPYHELNGSWFWWGKNHCSPDEIKSLYRFTADYLKNKKGIHHLLYAFNTDKFSSEEEYLERYPGDEYVDLLGFDIYQRQEGNEAFIQTTDRLLTVLEKLSASKRKIPALTEFGYGTIPDSTWWTSTFWKAIGHHQISYVLGWRNAGKKENGEMEFYVPYKGQQSADDFRKFYAIKKTLFAKDLLKENIYR